MSINAPEQTYEMEIVSTELPESFEADLQEANEAFTNQSERTAYLTTLAAETMINAASGEKVSLLEALEDHATTTDAANVEASRSKVDEVVNRVLHTAGKGEKGATVFRLSMDGNSQVTDVRRRVVLTQDSAAISSAKRMSAQVPYGPKQNDSSFRRSA